MWYVYKMGVLEEEGWSRSKIWGKDGKGREGELK